MDDYISREAAWNGIYSCPTKTDADGYIWVRTKDVAHMIDEIPAADVRPVAKARWEDETGYIFNQLAQRVYCPVCKSYAYFYPITAKNFCPNCGADMREPNLDTTKGERRDESIG